MSAIDTMSDDIFKKLIEIETFFEKAAVCKKKSILTHELLS